MTIPVRGVSTSKKPDVLVIGGGAIGVASAYELARRGARVLLVERGPELAWGCSAGNAGLICPSHAAPLATPAALRLGLRWMLKRDSPFYVRPRASVMPWVARFALACTAERAKAATNLIRSLSRTSLDLHAELAAAGVDTGFTRNGILNVYETSNGFEAGRREAELHRNARLRCTVLDPAEARSLEPTLVAPIAGAVYYPDEAHCDPWRFVQALGGAAASAGAEIYSGVEVLAIRRDASRVRSVETTAGVIHPKTVVLAAGVWTRQLARGLGLRVPLEGGKGYHLDIEPPPRAPRVPVFLQESRVIATPLTDRIRFAGTLELAGLDLRVDPIRLDAMARAGWAALGLDHPRVLEVWGGLRPCAPDGLPILGRAAGLENLVLATGHAMLGLTLAPVTGRLVAADVAGDETEWDLNLLRPDRFSGTLRSPSFAHTRRSR